MMDKFEKIYLELIEEQNKIMEESVSLRNQIRTYENLRKLEEYNDRLEELNEVLDIIIEIIKLQQSNKENEWWIEMNTEISLIRTEKK